MGVSVHMARRMRMNIGATKHRRFLLELTPVTQGRLRAWTRPNGSWRIPNGV
jgi:hypothetical protein